MDKKKRTIAKRVLSYVLVCALVLTASVLPQTVENVYAQEEQTEEEYLYIPLYTTGKVAKVKISNGTSGEIDVGKNPNSATMDAYGRLYVSNREGKTISVIDMDKFEIVDTISIGKMVYGVTFDPTFENLYIGTSNGIDVYNIKEKTKTTIFSGSIFLCSVTKEKVYAVRYNTTKLYIYDIMNQNTTEVDTGTSPKYIGNISPDEKKYVINGTSTRTQIIDLEDNNKKLGEINVFAYYADFSSDSKYLFLMVLRPSQPDM